MKSAALAFAFLLTPMSAMGQQISVEAYGGITLERDEDYSGIMYPIDQGSAFGAAVYVSGVMPSVSFGLDVMSTRALYTGFPGDYIDTVSIMAVARYEMPLTTGLTGYAGAGMGIIRNAFDWGGVIYADNVAGGQVSLGLRYGLTDTSSVFTEAKYQKSFSDADFSDLGDTQSYQSTSVLIGYRHSF